jgi:hypothetical protein
VRPQKSSEIRETIIRSLIVFPEPPKTKKPRAKNTKKPLKRSQEVITNAKEEILMEEMQKPENITDNPIFYYGLFLV